MIIKNFNHSKREIKKDRVNFPTEGKKNLVIYYYNGEEKQEDRSKEEKIRGKKMCNKRCSDQNECVQMSTLETTPEPSKKKHESNVIQH